MVSMSNLLRAWRIYISHRSVAKAGGPRYRRRRARPDIHRKMDGMADAQDDHRDISFVANQERCSGLKLIVDQIEVSLPPAQY